MDTNTVMNQIIRRAAGRAQPPQAQQQPMRSSGSADGAAQGQPLKASPAERMNAIIRWAHFSNRGGR